MAEIDEGRLQVKIARLYYERDLTQGQIAKRIGLSRQKVQRLLKGGRANGVVEILINPATGVFPEFETALQERYGLKDAVVFETTDYEDIKIVAAELGAVGAAYFCGLVKSGERIAMTGGSTVLEMVNSLRHHPRPDVHDVAVVQSFGGLGDANFPQHVTLLAQRLAAHLGAQCMMLSAPAIAESSQMRDAFYSDPGVSGVLDEARRATLAVTGVGPIKGRDSFFGEALPYPDMPTPKGMIELGAVGDLMQRFFDKDGRPIQHEFDERLVGLTLDELRSIDTVLGMLGGAARFDAVKGLLAGGIVDILITDHVTAGRLTG